MRAHFLVIAFSVVRCSNGTYSLPKYPEVEKKNLYDSEFRLSVFGVVKKNRREKFKMMMIE